MGRIGLWPSGWRYLFFSVTAVPLLLGACCVFYLLFERPFVSKHAKSARVQEKLGTPPAMA